MHAPLILPAPCITEVKVAEDIEDQFGHVMAVDTQLVELRRQVGHVCASRGRQHWRDVTEAVDLAAHLRAQNSFKVASRSFFKMRELLETFPALIKTMTSTQGKVLMLCEAPGGFCQALQSKRASAATPIYVHSLVAQDAPCFHSSLRHVEKLQFEDASADLTHPAVVEALKAQFGGLCSFITADGVQGRPNDVEHIAPGQSELWLAEAVVIAHCLAPGGAAVLKLLGMETPTSVRIAHAFSVAFATAHVIKLTTSRKCTSEIMLVGEKYSGDSEIFLAALNGEEPISRRLLLCLTAFRAEQDAAQKLAISEHLKVANGKFSKLYEHWKHRPVPHNLKRHLPVGT